MTSDTRWTVTWWPEAAVTARAQAMADDDGNPDDYRVDASLEVEEARSFRTRDRAIAFARKVAAISESGVAHVVRERLIPRYRPEEPGAWEEDRETFVEFDAEGGLS